MDAIKKRFEIIWVSPHKLIPYVKNAKIHSDKQTNEIAGQISAFGFDQPIVVQPDMVIIKGHGRREAALKLNLSEVPVIVQTLDEYQAMAARIADNKVAEAPWDPELLKFDLGTLKLKEFQMNLTGIGDIEIENILVPHTSETMFSERDHQSVSERKDQYDQSELRQIILVTDAEGFESLMQQFSALQSEFSVETNLEVVEKLMEHYAANRDHEQV